MTEFKHKILVVDDEAELAHTFQIWLQQKGYEVSIAFDGPQALRLVAAKRPDLILLDVWMPGMSGLEVLERLKADPQTRGIPVIILSAANQYEDMQKGWQGGTDLYLTKPIQLIQLSEYIETVLKP